MTDLEEWVRKTKPTMKDEDWARVEADAWWYPEDGDAGGNDAQGEALLADRDKVAAGLSNVERSLVQDVYRGYVLASGWQQSITHLCGRGLLERCESVDGEPAVRLTNFGRSVARKEQER